MASVPAPGDTPVATEARDTRGLDPRTRRLLEAPIVPMLLRMAWPNILIMVAQASIGIIEIWWVAKLGSAPLAGMTLVFPAVMLMQMISGGAMGGGISSAVARALGAGRRDDADALVLHAIAINGGLGLMFSLLFLTSGRWIYAAMGGEGAELEAAMTYSNVVFTGIVLLWVMNGLASVIRGTGNMLFPALVICVGVVLLIPLSPLLIFGWGPIPALGIAGGGAALLLFYACATAVMVWYLMSGRNLARLRWVTLRWSLMKSILRVGAVSAITSVQTNVTIAVATSYVAAVAGLNAVAGFGTGVRLEYLLIPFAFGVGAPMVALVGANIGAGRQDRALKIAMTGGLLAFVLTESVGLAAAIWPQAWIRLFSQDPQVIEAGVAYLRIVGPCYGFFGMGMSLYFASQGAGRMGWPLASGFVRLTVALLGGWLAMTLTGSLVWIYACLAAALVIFGTMIVTAIRAGTWFR